ncbi:TadE/TadG family type IV pilus assembly protein [Nocardioides pelophilus]|uniref:TadE/TadG family type IV pilus assembly protein n=1 Tax=Nocardioides pelophilus TaxID=2172019 RepID=UPI001601B76A|nr:TadE/TadG family type IV pilus assembly protein [Nocardioides pelophilus]
MRRALRWGAGSRDTGRDDRGAAALEFGLVLVPLLILVVGIINFGWMLSFRQNVSQAAAEGARAAAVQPPGTGAVAREDAAEAAIDDALAETYGVDCSTGICDIEPDIACTSGPASARCAQVTLTVQQEDFILVPGLGFGFIMPDTLTYTTEVRIS